MKYSITIGIIGIFCSTASLAQDQSDLPSYRNVTDAYDKCQKALSNKEYEGAIVLCQSSARLGESLAKAPKTSLLPTASTRMLSWISVSNSSVNAALSYGYNNGAMTADMCKLLWKAVEATLNAKSINSSAPGMSDTIVKMAENCPVDWRS